MISILIALGTRPEAIKLAPVYKELRARTDRIRVKCCVTGQHRDLVDPFLEFFEIQPDYDLNILKENQGLTHIVTSVLQGVEELILSDPPDMIIVQGDTSSAFAAALAGFYHRIPTGHVEAGLRSYDRFQPYPEEVNRTFISRIADLHFCPTQRAADNLRREQVDPSAIHITGNTVIDALLDAVATLDRDNRWDELLGDLNLPDGRMILVTGHRRENFGAGLKNLSLALRDLAERYHDVTVVYSAHPNPNVRGPLQELLGSHERIKVIPPPDYLKFVGLMKRAYLIITDSGGIQEEAPSLSKPVLVARALTERPEAVESGAAMIVGTDREVIVREASLLLEESRRYASMVIEKNPFGDGRAAQRIADIIESYFSDRT